MTGRHTGCGGIAPPFLTTSLHGDEWSASRLCRFTSWETATATHSEFSSFILVSWGGVKLSSLGTLAINWPILPARMIDDDECGTVGGMIIGRGSGSTRRKSAPMPLCPPQIPHDRICDRTRAAAVWSRRPTAWAILRPTHSYIRHKHSDIQKLQHYFLFSEFVEIDPPRWGNTIG
jgi:hypothetical protein